MGLPRRILEKKWNIAPLSTLMPTEYFTPVLVLLLGLRNKVLMMPSNSQK